MSSDFSLHNLHDISFGLFLKVNELIVLTERWREQWYSINIEKTKQNKTTTTTKKYKQKQKQKHTHVTTETNKKRSC